MSHTARTLAVQHHSVSHVGHDTAPYLGADSQSHVLEHGIFMHGPFLGQPYEIGILPPSAAWACHEISEAQLACERVQGIENVKPRSLSQIQKNMSFNLHPPEAQKGGLVIGLTAGADKQLLVVGGVLLVNEPSDGGRGAVYSQCPVEQQVVMSMGIAHPEFQGHNFAGMILPYRLHLAQSFANRTHLVTKTAGEKTKGFYQNKLGFVQDGSDHLLPGVAEPHNRLATLGKPMTGVRAYLAEKHPHVAATRIDLHSLDVNHKKSQPTLV